VIFNAHNEAIDYKLPAQEYAKKWDVVIDTASYEQQNKDTYSPMDIIRVDGRSVIVLRHELIKDGNKEDK
jgi:isoamylase